MGLSLKSLTVILQKPSALMSTQILSFRTVGTVITITLNLVSIKFRVFWNMISRSPESYYPVSDKQYDIP